MVNMTVPLKLWQLQLKDKNEHLLASLQGYLSASHCRPHTSNRFRLYRLLFYCPRVTQVGRFG